MNNILIPEEFKNNSFINHESIKNKTKSQKKFYSFNDSMKAAEAGEAKIYNILAEAFTVDDVTKNEDYFEQDIDFIIEQDSKQLSLEVKVDFQGHQTGNLFYEEYSTCTLLPGKVQVSKGIYHQEVNFDEFNSQGCFEKSQANYLLYYLNNSEEILIIDFKELRKLFKKNKKLFKQATVNNDKTSISKDVEVIKLNNKDLKELDNEHRIQFNELIDEGVIQFENGVYYFEKDDLTSNPFLQELINLVKTEDSTVKKQMYKFRTSLGYKIPLEFIKENLSAEVIPVDELNEKLKELF